MKVMVLKGIRKKFNNDREAQLASIEAARRRDWEAIENKRLRQAISWYYVKDGIWLEVEVTMFGKVLFRSYPTKPIRHLWDYSITIKDVRYPVETGFIGDGLIHGLWLSGGKWVHNDEHGSWVSFDIAKSKGRLYHKLITTITPLPELFKELYGCVVSISMIQEAFKTITFNDRGGATS